MKVAEAGSRRTVVSWAFYDWANSAFATTVMAGFFPILYSNYWRGGTETTVSTAELGIASSIASLAMALLAPILGAFADHGGGKRRFLAIFAMLGILSTAVLFWIGQDYYKLALVVFGLALLGFAGANIFYDALLVGVARKEKRDFVSALGYSLGYLGGGLLFAVNVWMVQKPETFGLADATQAARVSFLLVSIWWLVFSIPILLFVPEAKMAERLPLGQAAVQGLRQIVITFKEIRQLRAVWMFLVAYWLYIDGVDTIIRMATKIGDSLNIEQGTLIKALLITQFVGFPAAILFGKIGEKIGTKRGIYIGILVYAGITVFGYQMSTDLHFYILAVAVGLVQGGVQALSRSYYSRLIPQDKSGEFFGFYNMIGKYAAILGPLMMAAVASMTGSDRLPILSLLLLFVGGAAMLMFVREDEGATSSPA